MIEDGYKYMMMIYIVIVMPPIRSKSAVPCLPLDTITIRTPPRTCRTRTEFIRERKKQNLEECNKWCPPTQSARVIIDTEHFIENPRHRTYTEIKNEKKMAVRELVYSQIFHKYYIYRVV